MTRKLTLSADTRVIAKAKKLAAKRGTTVSAMFAQFVAAIDAKDKPDVPPGPITRRLFGIASFPKGKPDRELLTEALEERFGGKK
ncbi:MAG: DUF6364 family protein [Planctomycetaceae bacterium]|nr:DUF6364 family protein [Planctomycetaceae bacterium]